MKRILLVSFAFFAINFPSESFAGTFVTKSDGGGMWNVSTTWAFAGDADGIPDFDDDITILSGDVVTWNTNSTCRHITVNAGGTLSSTGGASKVLGVYGNFTINGTENCVGTIEFRTNGMTVGGTGTHGTQSIWIFSASTTIANTITVNKNYYIRLYGASTVVTNFANLSVHSINAITNGATWVQGTGSVVRTRTNMLMDQPATGIFDAQTNPNTVILDFTPVKQMPTVLNETFYNLTIPLSRYANSRTNFTVRNDLTIGNNAILNANHNITIRRHFNVVVGGAFNAAPGTTLTFNGNVTQNIVSGINLNFQNLVINNTGATGVTITNARVYNVLQSLRLLDGVFNVNAATSFNLISNATQTAVIGPSSSAASVTGNIIAQRFISARAAGYSDMSGCMQGQTLNDWNDDLLMVYAYSPPDFYPSVWGYDETGFDYVPITSPTEPLSPGKGIMVYLDSDGSQTTFNSTTVTNRGQPNLGTFDISGDVTFDNDGWNLVGNPYHANISWDALFATTSGIAPDIMSYDETEPDGAGGFGNFITLTTGSGVIIAPEQGFWVNVTNSSPNLAFTEAIKSSSLSSTFRSATPENFGLRLASVGGTKYVSKTNFRFSTSPESETKGDLSFKKPFQPESPSLYTYSDEGKRLMIKLLDANEDVLTIPVHFNVKQDGLFVVSPQNIDYADMQGYTSVLLIDHKTKRTIDLKKEKYQFYALASEESDRFTLKLSRGEAAPATIAATSNEEININRIGDNTIVTLKFSQDTPVNITITDLLGQSVLPAQHLVAQQQTVSLAMPQSFSGIYLVNVFYGDKVESKKLFK